MVCLAIPESAHALSALIDEMPAHSAQPAEPSPEELRAAPRRSRQGVAWIRFLDESGPTESHGYELCDFSKTGLGLFSRHPLDPGQPVLVEMMMGDACWCGRMSVAHCTETPTGYRVGLASHVPLVREKIAPAVSESDESHLAAQAKAKIGQMMKNDALARRTCGLLGVSIRKVISDTIRRFPLLPNANRRGRRRHPRRRMTGQAHLVMPDGARWRVVHTDIVDVSEGGVALAAEWYWDQRCYDPRCEPRFGVELNNRVFVGLETRKERLWVTGRISNCTGTDDGRMRIGIAFDFGQ